MTALSLRSKKNSFTIHNEALLIQGGQAYFEHLLQLIRAAKDCIHLQTFIFEEDHTGMSVSRALIEAAQRGVRVMLLVDGYASQQLSTGLLKQFKDGGVSFRFFEPLIRSRYFYFGRRLHHKVVVVDHLYALVGGINVADKYNDFPGKPGWLDFAVLMKGTIVPTLGDLCWKTWNGFKAKLPRQVCPKQKIKASFLHPQDCLIRMRRNDWVLGKNEISTSYMQLFTTAKEEITILCSYFLPGHWMRKQMQKAIKRGVRIQVIVAGRSDVPLSKHAERYLYDWMIRNGMEVYEYKKNVLHGKVAVADQMQITIGSYNVNDISAYASIELNVDIRHQPTAQALHHRLQQIILQDCEQITEMVHRKRKDWFIQLLRWASYELVRLMIYLTTFYYKKQV